MWASSSKSRKRLRLLSAFRSCGARWRVRRLSRSGSSDCPGRAGVGVDFRGSGDDIERQGDGRAKNADGGARRGVAAIDSVCCLLKVCFFSWPKFLPSPCGRIFSVRPVRSLPGGHCGSYVASTSILSIYLHCGSPSPGGGPGSSGDPGNHWRPRAPAAVVPRPILHGGLSKQIPGRQQAGIFGPVFKPRLSQEGERTARLHVFRRRKRTAGIDRSVRRATSASGRVPRSWSSSLDQYLILESTLRRPS
jgi:hypothetical protein